MKNLQNLILDKFVTCEKIKLRNTADGWDYKNLNGGVGIAEIKYSTAYSGQFENVVVIAYDYTKYNDISNFVVIGTLKPNGKLELCEPTDEKEKWLYPPVDMDCENVRVANRQDIEKWRTMIITFSHPKGGGCAVFPLFSVAKDHEGF